MGFFPFLAIMSRTISLSVHVFVWPSVALLLVNTYKWDCSVMWSNAGKDAKPLGLPYTAGVGGMYGHFRKELGSSLKIGHSTLWISLF